MCHMATWSHWQCDHAFSWAGHLRRHLKPHSGEKSNKCNQSDYASSQTGHFWGGIWKHTVEKSQTKVTHGKCQILWIHQHHICWCEFYKGIQLLVMSGTRDNIKMLSFCQMQMRMGDERNCVSVLLQCSCDISSSRQFGQINFVIHFCLLLFYLFPCFFL